LRDEESSATYPQCLLGLEDFGQRLTSFYAERVPLESSFFDIVACDQVLEMGFNIGRGVQFEGLALERKDFGRHGCCKLPQTDRRL